MPTKSRTKQAKTTAFERIVAAKQAALDAEAAAKKAIKDEQDRRYKAAFRPIREVLQWMIDTEVTFPGHGYRGYPREKAYWVQHRLGTHTVEDHNIRNSSAEFYFGDDYRRFVISVCATDPATFHVGVFERGYSTQTVDTFLPTDKAIEFILDLVAQHALR